MDVTFKKLTRLEHIASVPERWKGQYECPETGWVRVFSIPFRQTESAEDIYNKLIALPHIEIQEEAINEIIGNSSWTSFTCDHCGEEAHELVSLGDTDITGEEYPNQFCESCLLKALAIIKEEDSSNGNT